MPATPDPVVPPIIQAATVNWLIESVRRLNNLTGADGVEVDGTTSNPVLRVRVPEVGFWAAVYQASPAYSGSGSGYGGAAYDWVEQQPIGGGEFEDDPFGRTGLSPIDPAYSVPPDAVVTDGDVVWLVRGLAVYVPAETGADAYVRQEWYFTAGGAGGAHVEPPGSNSRIALSDLGGCVGGFWSWNFKAIEAANLRALDDDCNPVTLTDPCPPE